MIKYVFGRNQMKCLNHIIGDKSDISILNNYESKELSESDVEFFKGQGILADDGGIHENVREGFAIMANPDAVVKITFTGGIAKYEHYVCYNRAKKQHISFTATPDLYSVESESDLSDIKNAIEDFVGGSELKSVSLYHKLSVQEALVIATLLDMERKSILRAFVDELPYTSNQYGFNMIWRMIHSTNPSVQWLVHCLGEAIGKPVTLNQQQVQSVLARLVELQLVSEKAGQYQLSSGLCQLANRMLVIDSVITIEAVGRDDNNRPVSAGFTCIQAGVHDLLSIDYDGAEVVLETINSASLLKYVDQFLQAESFLSQ